MKLAKFISAAGMALACLLTAGTARAQLTPPVASWARDCVNPAVSFPCSGSSQWTPQKPDIRSWGGGVETAISSLAVSSAAGAVGYTTKASLNADLNHGPGTLATVFVDSTVANNGIYIKSGASGSGSWAQVSTNIYGVLPTWNIGTVTTLPAGYPAAASVSGAPGSPVLNLSLPQGATVMSGGGSICLLSATCSWTGGQIWGQTGAYTNGVSNSPYQFVLNGLNIDSLVSSVQGGNHATNALEAGVLVPSTSTVYQANAISGVIQSNAAGVSTGGYVAGYFQATANANGANMFGINPICTDTVGLVSVKCQNEFDFNINNSGTAVAGINMVLGGTVTPSVSNAYGVVLAPGYSGQWGGAFVSGDNAAFQAFIAGVQSAGNSKQSQPIIMRSRNSGGSILQSQIYSDASGAIISRTAVNGAVHAFQDYNSGAGSNLAYIGTGGFNISVPVVVAGLAGTGNRAACVHSDGSFYAATGTTCP